jgi:hypothetical protein
LNRLGGRWLNLTIVVTCVVVVTVAADITMRNREMNRLLAAVEQSESAMKTGSASFVQRLKALSAEDNRLTREQQEQLL